MYDLNEGQQYPDPGLCNRSASRPPHLNQTVCGCRCGRASGHSRGSDDDDRQNDDTLTLVGSDTSDNEFGFRSEATLDEAVDTSRILASQSPFQEGFSRVSSPGMPAGHSLYGSPGSESDYSDTADSMDNEPSSDAHSEMTADSRSVHPMSPGPGQGAWADLEYHFLARPLRLTPQAQYCRGVVASHLILDDDQCLGL
ncbi:hypothetical protein DPSP01_008259 [Paraphaeosphaeria sporulosa]|uniref:Uncharacterized protein n=1 Tax=Paraphaeosphaeria sporulosa TaxID=1460663 RepID=A0A177BVY1_9PLEO|nr:uncharacterized protein CC84DRAFT_1210526 [Paraphaeosphaeria sporulosa]OAF99090.1 hypothetical protein CC84DRAFT_1210526 [Paraphaeosphaeria sporulosa]